MKKEIFRNLDELKNDIMWVIIATISTILNSN